MCSCSILTLRLKDIKCLMPVDTSGFHDEVYLFGSRDFGNGVARERNDIGLLARCEHTNIVLL